MGSGADTSACDYCELELSCNRPVKYTRYGCHQFIPLGGHVPDFVHQLNEALRKDDRVTHPKHYTSHPSGIECIQVTEHMNFNLGNAIKYIWRCDLKKDDIEDLKKAIWYIEREIAKREVE